jgi:hypothetical protein
VTFEPINVLAIDYTDQEPGYAQDQWPVVFAWLEQTAQAMPGG